MSESIKSIKEKMESADNTIIKIKKLIDDNQRNLNNLIDENEKTKEASLFWIEELEIYKKILIEDLKLILSKL